MMFVPNSATSPSENSTLYILVSKIGFLSSFPMGCPSKSLTVDLTVPETMSFPFSKTTSAPMYEAYMMGVGSSSHSLAWGTPSPSSSSYNYTLELNNPLQSPVCLLMIPALSVSIGHMILFSSFPLGYFAHLQLSACMMICTHTFHFPLESMHKMLGRYQC